MLRKIRVDELADSGQVYGGHAYHDALDVAHTQHVPIVYPRATVDWQTDDSVILHFIGPSLPFIGGRNSINDNSVAFMLTYKHFRMLFTGDAGADAEQRFIHEYVDLHADVLKVGHHGSAYSSSLPFLEAVHPRYALISVGRHEVPPSGAGHLISEMKVSNAKTESAGEAGTRTREVRALDRAA